MPSFDLGRRYTRIYISQKIGGGQQPFLPTSSKRVVCCCFEPRRNQLAPDVLLVGGRRHSAARILAMQNQSEGIPVFKKIRSNEWEYIGDYQVQRWTEDSTTIAFESKRGNHDEDVKIVLFLAPAGEKKLAITSQSLADAEKRLSDEGEFDVESVKDDRDRIAASIVRRRGQPEFRRKLLAAYKNHCLISACDSADALEAAHIRPYCGEASNHITNGVLLRADLHTLFDLGKISIDAKSQTVVISEDLKKSVYGKLHGGSINLPSNTADRPNFQFVR
jgi:hypothetical protein